MTAKDQALYAAYRDIALAYTLLMRSADALRVAGLEPTSADAWANEVARIGREIPEAVGFLFDELERRTE